MKNKHNDSKFNQAKVSFVYTDKIYDYCHLFNLKFEKDNRSLYGNLAS